MKKIIFQVYGLSFMKEEDARLFVKVMTQALSLLTSSSDYQNGRVLKEILMRPVRIYITLLIVVYFI